MLSETNAGGIWSLGNVMTSVTANDFDFATELVAGSLECSGNRSFSNEVAEQRATHWAHCSDTRLDVFMCLSLRVEASCIACVACVAFVARDVPQVARAECIIRGEDLEVIVRCASAMQGDCASAQRGVEHSNVILTLSCNTYQIVQKLYNEKSQG